MSGFTYIDQRVSFLEGEVRMLKERTAQQGELIAILQRRVNAGYYFGRDRTDDLNGGNTSHVTVHTGCEHTPCYLHLEKQVQELQGNRHPELMERILNTSKP